MGLAFGSSFAVAVAEGVGIDVFLAAVSPFMFQIGNANNLRRRFFGHNKNEVRMI